MRYRDSVILFLYVVSMMVTAFRWQAQAAQSPAGESMSEDVSVPRKAGHVIYFELMGNGELCSMNYERLIGEYCAARIGACILPVGIVSPETPDSYNAGVVCISSLLGPKNGNTKLELGAGFSVTSEFDFGSGFSNRKSWLTGVVGLRYQPKERGIVFRAGFTPYIEYNFHLPCFLWGGVSLGYAF